MDTDSEYYNIYSKEPTAKVTIYTSVLYFVIVIYESMADVFLTIRLLIFIVTKDLIFFYNKLILVLFMGRVNKKSDNPEV